MSRSYFTPRKARGVALQSALVEWRHRLAAQQLAQNLAAIERVHSASARLQPSRAVERQAALDKQETPRPGRQEASTDAMTLTEVERGRSTECA